MALTVTDQGDVAVTFNPGGSVTARKIKLSWADTDTHSALASATFPGVSSAKGVVFDTSGESWGYTHSQILAGALSRYAQNAWVGHQFTENGTDIKCAVLRSINPPITQIYQGATGNF